MLGPFLAAIASALLVGGVGEERTPESVREVAEGIVDRGGYQRELPGFGKSSDASDRDGDSRRTRTRRTRSDDEIGDAIFEESDEPGRLATPIAIAAAVTFLVLTGLVLLARRADAASQASTRASITPSPIPPRAAPPPGLDPSSLAAEGRFAEAVHELLLAVLARCARWLAHPAVPGTTAREFVSHLTAAPQRERLRELVLLAERGRFADRPLDAEDWRRASELAAPLLERSTAASRAA